MVSEWSLVRSSRRRVGAGCKVHAAATVIDSPTGDQHFDRLCRLRRWISVVRAAVAASLPVYMVPTVWVGIDDVVLNSAGKLDQALPEPDFGSVGQVRRAREPGRVVGDSVRRRARR